MKALSIQQPWASLILGIAPKTYLDGCTHPKDIENRTWKTGYRGDLLIHAGKRFDVDALEHLYDEPPPGAANWLHDNFTLGAILGVVTLVDLIRDSDSAWAIEDCYHWMLSNPRAFNDPIPYKGQLGLFNVPMTLYKLHEQTTTETED